MELAESIDTKLVIFPECAVTNGTGIINFEDFGIGYEMGKRKVHVLGLVQEGSFFSPNFVKGNGFYHILLMLGRVVSNMKVKVGLPQDVPRGKIDRAFIERCRFVLSRIIGVPEMDINADESFATKDPKLHRD